MQQRLESFVDNLKKYDAKPNGKWVKDFLEMLEWSGFDDQRERRKFLKGPTREDLSRFIQDILGD